MVAIVKNIYILFKLEFCQTIESIPVLHLFDECMAGQQNEMFWSLKGLQKKHNFICTYNSSLINIRHTIILLVIIANHTDSGINQILL